MPTPGCVCEGRLRQWTFGYQWVTRRGCCQVSVSRMWCLAPGALRTETPSGRGTALGFGYGSKRWEYQSSSAGGGGTHPEVAPCHAGRPRMGKIHPPEAVQEGVCAGGQADLRG